MPELARELDAYELDRRSMRKDGMRVWAHIAVLLVRILLGEREQVTGMGTPFTLTIGSPIGHRRPTASGIASSPIIQKIYNSRCLRLLVIMTVAGCDIAQFIRVCATTESSVSWLELASSRFARCV